MTDSPHISHLPSGPATDTFRIPAYAYFRGALAGPGVGGAFIGSSAGIAVASVAFFVAGVILPDIRFILVALMILFIAIPAILAFAYFRIAMSPDATRATLPHSITFRPDDTILIEYSSHTPTESVNDGETPKFPPDEIIPASDIHSVGYGSSRLTIKLLSGRLIFVPYDAMDSETARECLSRLNL